MLDRLDRTQRIWPAHVRAIVTETQKLIEENARLKQANAASDMGRIIAIANDRLRRSGSRAESDVLWKIIEIAEGKDDRELNIAMRANLRQAFVAGAQWAVDDTDEDVMITLANHANGAALRRWPEPADV